MWLGTEERRQKNPSIPQKCVWWGFFSDGETHFSVGVWRKELSRD